MRNVGPTKCWLESLHHKSSTAGAHYLAEVAGVFQVSESVVVVVEEGGDEIDGVVTVPVLEAVLSVEEFVGGGVASGEAGHGEVITKKAVALKCHCR